MKKLLIFVTFFSIGMTFGQSVGINTSTPLATLDINGNLRIKTVKPIIPVSIPYVLTVDANDNNIVKKFIATPNPVAPTTKCYGLFFQQSKVFLRSDATDIPVNFGAPKINGKNCDDITFSDAGNYIKFSSPNKYYKITAYVGIRGGKSGNGTTSTQDNPGYVTSQWSYMGSGQSYISTLGYTESSTENYDDGGVTLPIMIFSTGSGTNSYVFFYAGSGGTSVGDGLYLAMQPVLPGSNGLNGSVGTYYIIEEIN